MIVDTSGALAALDADEPDHARCAAALLDANNAPLILSPYVLAELDYLIITRAGVEHEIEFLDDVASGAYILAPWDNDDHRAALDVVKQYRDLEIGIADASNVVLADRYRTTELLTLDRHFRTVRPLSGKGAFTLLPADAP